MKIESAWHCVFCGQSLFYENDPASLLPEGYKLIPDGPRDMHCKKCDVHFSAHAPGNQNKRCGDSFSLTYIE